MKLVGKILSFLAITIIIAHTVIPHIHHSEISEKEHIYQHQQAKTIFDYIALAFHSEQQGGGFEEFVQGQYYPGFDSVQVSSVAIIFTAFSLSDKEPQTEEFIISNIPIRNNLYPENLKLRGPPLKS